MMRRYLSFLGLLIIISTLLTSCSEEKYKGNPIVGEWKNTIIGSEDVVLNNTLIFHANGKFSFICESSIKNEPQETQIGDGTYEINDTEFRLTYNQVSGALNTPKGISSEELMGLYNNGTTVFNYRFEGDHLRIRRNENGTGVGYLMIYTKSNN